MTADNSQQKEQPPAPNLDDFIVTDYETRNMSEILKGWLPELLPWRKKKRKDL